jgi:hypothetical protein
MTIHNFKTGKRPRVLKPALILLMLGAIAASGVGIGAASTGAATIRPISDFVSTQGTYCIDDGMGGCFLFVPPVANYIGWTAPAAGNLFALADYAGLANAYIIANGGTSLGTTTQGSVIERALPDGRAEVSVLLHTRNALTWVSDVASDFSDFPGTLLFGNRVPEVLGGSDVAPADCFLQAVFINTGPSEPLPDLIQIAFFPEPGQQMRYLSFRAAASGQLRAAYGVSDGTPGRAHVTQTGLFMTGGGGATADGFPAELVKLQVVGQ